MTRHPDVARALVAGFVRLPGTSPRTDCTPWRDDVNPIFVLVNKGMFVSGVPISAPDLAAALWDERVWLLKLARDLEAGLGGDEVDTLRERAEFLLNHLSGLTNIPAEDFTNAVESLC